MSLLEAKDLKKHFPIHGGIFLRQVARVYAVDGIDLEVAEGEVLGLVGESGCGKSTVGRTLMRLYEPTEGKVVFQGRDLAHAKGKELLALRKDLQMIFQDPFESLNPRHSIQQILEEPFLIHTDLSAAERLERVHNLLERVGLDKSYTHRYPHEFSGGQRQRIGIARAVSLRPKLIICDEPVSALDVSIQSQVINLLLELQAELNLSYVFIAHDLAVVKHISDRIAVMYLGKIVETAAAHELYERPMHPYTRALISAIPVPDPRAKRQKQVLHGDVPSPIHPPNGCRFHTRCPYVEARCRQEEPILREFGTDEGVPHRVACHRVEEIF